MLTFWLGKVPVSPRVRFYICIYSLYICLCIYIWRDRYTVSLSLSDICHVADKDVPKLDNLIGTMDFGSHALNAPRDHDTLQTCKCK